MAQRLKDIFFTSTSLSKLSAAIAKVYPAFERRKFFNAIHDEAWAEKELLERMHHIAACLRQALPPSYAEALEILKKVAPQIEGFDAMVFPDFVEQYGLEDWERSLPALAFFTRFGSAEFAIRPFLLQNPPRAMAFMRQCAEDADPLVRRLASEGRRPRLPWAVALPAFKKDPSLILPILEKLKDDEAETVRRSVANNLNDISKDHPDLVLQICERWRGRSQHTDGIIKHACRSLLKAGNKRALRLFGFKETQRLRVRNLKLARQRMVIGEELRFSFDLEMEGKKALPVRLEYAVDFVKAHGGTSAKVFQISEKNFAPGVHTVHKRYSTADKTTRKHHPGRHRLAIIVNGLERAQAWFALVKK